MTTLLDSSTATGATATEGDVKTYLANLRTYMADLLGTDSSDKAAVNVLLGSVLNGKIAKTTSYTVVAADRGKVIDCTGSITITITAAATLGDGFSFAARNSGTGTVSLDPNMAEQINGKTTESLLPGDFVIVYCDGASFSTVGGKPGAIYSMVRLNTVFGYGSTNTKIRRFSTIIANSGPDITYADSASAGASFTVNNSGIYSISYTDAFDAASYFGISLNSSQLSSGFESITLSNKLAIGTTAQGGFSDVVSWTGYLTAGDVIRCHTQGYTSANSYPSGLNLGNFTMARVS